MDPRSLEQAFARFRREHEIEALAEVFDRTARWRRCGRASRGAQDLRAHRVQLHRGFRQLRRLLPASFAFGAAALLAPRGPQSVEEHEILMAVGALPFGRLSYAATSPEGWSAKGSLDLAAGPELHLRVAIPLMRAR